MFDLPDVLLQRLRNAQSITVLTGGGLAQECGIPSFREAQQREERWAGYEPQELATVEAFLRNPRLVWEWFAYRRSLAQAAEPSAAHYALVDLEQLVPKFKLITQATDGLHWRAGSRELIELHGNLARMRSYEDGGLVDSWDENEIPPRCPRTGGYLRPDVVLYGEGVSRERLREADQATVCDVFLCIGTESVVQPAASLPLHAKRNGATVIEINRQPSTFGFFTDHTLHGTLSELLPQLVAVFE
ncbi:SIR2 family NAD-dependent protein deacylase [Herpetosiphon geysericola]|uniref:protein acetyllysine N-acetyltransferase n=1 Tax=Herpetosiphon geysericola TaxID=70996 RepID=A0A0P6YPB3_9CHLR|nr:Sir2 family NAD-dependent protein deacetylase [Herpetosiphon geysericola]KPL87069.1 NAD-dependent protein deacylase [Herpetosiphon geysericola]